MDLGDVESSLKILVLGAEGVGKTSLTSMFCRGEFPHQYKKTIGTEFKEKDVAVADSFEDVNLMIWEIGGEHTFAPMNSKHFKNANAVIIVFSTTDRTSFDKVRALREKVLTECGKKTLVLLVQNKIDLLDEAEMTPEEAEGLARELRVKLYRISCKESALVNKIFEYLASKLTGSSVALTDIVDVVPEVEESSSPHMELSTPVDAQGEPIDQRETTGALVQEKPGMEPVSARSGNTLVYPRDTAPPTGPSKQRTLGKKNRGCACM